MMRNIGLGTLILVTGCGSAPNSEVAEQPLANVAEVKAEPSDEGKLWVTSQYLDRHTCASDKCGIVGRLSFREAATVIERKGDWARVSKVYDASCSNGVSEYVDKGQAACTPENGIKEGKFAEWVLARHLSTERPADPAETAANDEKMVAQSDDFSQHRKAFVKAARQLIDQGRCTAADFEEQGGWVKSSNHPDQPMYFTYCGGMTVANRIYVNAETGQIS
jgi:hypothetical protein